MRPILFLKYLVYICILSISIFNITAQNVPGCVATGTPNCNESLNGDFSSGGANWSSSNWSISGGEAEFSGDNTNTKTGTITQSLTGLTTASDQMLIKFKVKISFNGCNPDKKFVNLTVRYEGIDYLVIERQNGGSVVSPLILKNGGILVATDSDVYAGKRTGSSGGGSCDLAAWHSIYLLVPKTIGASTGDLSFHASDNNGKFSQQVRLYLDDVEATSNSGGCGFTWLKADEGIATVTEGAAVGLWEDQALHGNDAYQTDNNRKPSYNKNVLNYNPGVYFDGSAANASNKDVLLGDSGYFSGTQIVVFKTDLGVTATTSAMTLIGANLSNTPNDISGFKLGDFSSNLTNEVYGVIKGTSLNGLGSGVASSGGITKSILVAQPNNSVPSDNWLVSSNGNNETNSTGGASAYADWAFSNYVLGGSPDVSGSVFSDYFTGHILEVITYPSKLTSIELQRVNSYLSIKYGITLGHNYISGDETLLFDVATYGNRVFGIGRDDCQGLHQRQAKAETENESDVLLSIGYNQIIGDENSSITGNDLPNDTFVLIGDDSNGISSWSSINAPINAAPESERLTRVWKSVATGALLSKTRIELEGAKLPSSPGSQENIAMVVASSASDISGATFSDANKIIIPMSKIGNNWVCDYLFSNATKYFTFIKYKSCYQTLVCSSTTTWNGVTWSNGAPDESTAAIIAADYDTGDIVNFSCCELTVTTGNTLTIHEGGKVDVQSNITNNGLIDIKDNGSLLQYYDYAINTGSIKVTRKSNPMYKFDYTYWSSPVSNDKLDCDL